MNQMHLLGAMLAAGFLLSGCAGHHVMGGGGEGPGIQVTDFPPKEREKRCDTNGACQIKVYARVGSAGQCEVRLEVSDIRVGYGFKPVMKWMIDPIDHGHYRYRFVFLPKASPPAYGVSIGGNDPAYDFDSPGADSGRIAFTWQNRHLRSKTFAYAINVERLVQPARPDDDWEFCDPVDPTIYNE